jgi:plasmid stability protein
MKTLTIRGIDSELANRIKERAMQNGESINKLSLRLLKSALGLREKKIFPVYHDLDHLAGTWAKEDEKEFYKNIQELEVVDKELWE